jgi:DNA polymerase I-like protein with 3'-5' exonuclease and polymerase domains
MAIDRKDKSTISFFARLEIDVLDEDWNIPSDFPDLTGHTEIAIDLETRDPRIKELGPGWARNDGYIVGVAVAAGDWYGYYPIRHENGHNMDPKIVMKWLKKQVETPHIDKIMHNATYDLGWLRAEGIEVQGRVIDTMITGAVVDENRWSYSLDNLGRDWIDMRKNEKMLRAAAKDWGVDPKADMWRLPPSVVGAYAEQDAIMTLKLWHRLKVELGKQDLWHIWNLETGLIPMMLDMRSQGVPVNISKAEQTRGELISRTKDLKAEIKRLTGVEIEPWAAASVQKVFESLNLEYPRTEAGAPSFTKQYLNFHPHPVAKLIVKLREFDKANTTFIDTILKHNHNGRIHTEFHQLRSDEGGTVTGRFCVAADTLIETQRGPVPIVDIKPRRDLALTHKGRLQPIRHLIYKGEEEMVELRVSSGKVLKCTRNHRVLTETGWVKVGELLIGQEIKGVDIQKGSGERGALQQRGAVLPLEGEAHHQAGGESLLRFGAHSSGHGSSGSFKRTPQGRAGSKVLSIKAWEKEPHDGQERDTSPQLQGSPVLRSGRVCVGAEAGLVHWPDGVKAYLRAQFGHGPDAWFDSSTRGYGSSSHRRGSNQQRPEQPCPRDSAGAPHTSCSVTVEAIEPVGVAQVWDIEVETDHSYIAHGLVHHNSCSNPNLQQIPARDPEIKKMIRGLFIPEEGAMWGSFDYSSQEPRLLVHFASVISKNDPTVDRIVEDYREGDADLHQMVADMAGISRKEAKTVNLGIMYGMGAAKLANQLDVSVEEAKDLMAKHREKVPFVKRLAEKASQRADENGQIRTLLGRLCRFPLWEPRTFGYNKPLPYDEAQKEYGPFLKRAFTYKALNKLIQGSAADQTKKAMADCYAEGLLPMLTVHDELCFSVESEEQAARIKEIMEKGLDDVLAVPSKVDDDIPALRGLPNNWGEVE